MQSSLYNYPPNQIPSCFGGFDGYSQLEDAAERYMRLDSSLTFSSYDYQALNIVWKFDIFVWYLSSLDMHSFNYVCFCSTPKGCNLVGDPEFGSKNASIPQNIYLREEFSSENDYFVVVTDESVSFNNSFFFNHAEDRQRIIAIKKFENLTTHKAQVSLDLKICNPANLTFYYYRFKKTDYDTWNFKAFQTKDYHSFITNDNLTYETCEGNFTSIYKTCFLKGKENYKTIYGSKFFQSNYAMTNNITVSCTISLNISGILRGLLIDDFYIVSGTSLNTSSSTILNSSIRVNMNNDPLLMTIIGYQLEVYSLDFIDCKTQNSPNVNPDITYLSVYEEPYKSITAEYKFASIACPAFCILCASTTTCIKCNEGYFLDNYNCVELCSDQTTNRISKYKYCDSEPRFTVLFGSSSIFDKNSYAAIVDYEVDLDYFTNFLMLVSYPSRVRFSNYPWITTENTFSLAEANFKWIESIDIFLELSTEIFTEVTANAFYPFINLLIVDFYSGKYLLVNFTNADQVFASKFSYMNQNISQVIQSYTESFQIIFFYTTDVPSQKLNLTFDGHVLIFVNERTLIFNATFASTQSYQLYRDFSNNTFFKIIVKNSNYFNFHFSSQSTLYAPKQIIFHEEFSVPIDYSCQIDGCLNCLDNHYCYSCQNGRFLSNSMGNCLFSCPAENDITKYEGRCGCVDSTNCMSPEFSRCDANSGFCSNCLEDNDCYHLQSLTEASVCISGLCVPCGSNCLSCDTSLKCSSCLTGYELANGTCSFYCSPGMKKVSEFGCQDVCGDGIKAQGLPYCDDKNTLDGDGCSSLCKVEKGWTCIGGSTSQRDFCYLIPDLTLTQLSSSTVEMKFNVKMAIQNLKQYTLIYFDSYNQSTVTTSLDLIDNSTYLITIYSEKNMAKPKLIVEFTSLDKIVSADNIQISQKIYSQTLNSIVKQVQLDAETKQTIQAIQTSIKRSSIAIFGLSSPTFAAGSNPLFLWGFLSLLQVFYFLLFINVEYPSNLKDFFGAFSMGTMNFFPNPSDMFTSDLKSHSLPSPPKFEENEVDGLFLNTGGSIFGLLIATLVLFLIIRLCYRGLKRFPKRMRNMITRLRSWIEWSGILRIWTTSYLTFTVSSALQIWSLDFSGAVEVISSLLGIIFFLTNLLFPVFMLYIISKSGFNHVLIKQKYGAFVEELTIDSRLSLCYNAFILMKWLLMALSLVFLYNYPFVMILMMILGNIFPFLLVIGKNPYEEISGKIVHAVEETTLIFIYLFIFIIAYDNRFDVLKPESSMTLGWIIMGLCCLNIIVGILAMIYCQFTVIREFYKKCKRKNGHKGVRFTGGMRKINRGTSKLKKENNGLHNEVYKSVDKYF